MGIAVTIMFNIIDKLGYFVNNIKHYERGYDHVTRGFQGVVTDR